MSTEETTYGLKVGKDAPEFELNTYDPNEMFFGKISLEQIKKAGKWTIVFFYPADFTFV
jgi:NADH-dependent peroxiredoxin subunit C